MYEDFFPIKRDFVFLEESISTNSDLKGLIYEKSLPVFSVICADRQSGGRGRLGRSFYSRAGGAYFSVSFPLSGQEKNIPFMTLLAGLCVSEVIEELTGVKTEIKWPNDIYYNGRKLGGILTELISKNGLTAVVGIGINLSVKEEEIPCELKNIMTSFEAEGLTAPERNTLIRRITERLDIFIYEKKLLSRENEEITGRIKERSFSIGKAVKYKTAEKEICGTVTDITPCGAAVLSLSDGTKKEIFCGELTQ